MTAPRPDLDALERLLAAVGPVLPLRPLRAVDAPDMLVDDEDDLLASRVRDGDVSALIAAAINALPALIAAAREQQRPTLDVPATIDMLRNALAAQRQQRERAEQQAADLFRLASTRTQDATEAIDRAEQAEQTLREAARQNCDECGGTGRIHSHNDICGCVDVPRLLREERQRRESVEQQAARLRAALEEVQEEVRAHIDQEAIRSSTGVVIPAIDRALYIIDAALAPRKELNVFGEPRECAPSLVSSRVCEYGTKGCTAKHHAPRKGERDGQ